MSLTWSWLIQAEPEIEYEGKHQHSRDDQTLFANHRSWMAVSEADFDLKSSRVEAPGHLMYRRSVIAKRYKKVVYPKQRESTRFVGEPDRLL